jgi:hypothetical protein
MVQSDLQLGFRTLSVLCQLRICRDKESGTDEDKILHSIPTIYKTILNPLSTLLAGTCTRNNP